MLNTKDSVTVSSARVPATALFNKLNGTFVSVAGIPLENFDYDKNYFIARAVEYDFTEDGDVIEGSIIIDAKGNATDDFKVIPRTQQTPATYESTLNELAEEKITKRYPLANQVTLLSKAVVKLGEAAGLADTEEFKNLSEMMDYISLCIKTNQTKKEFYKNDPNTVYYSDSEAAELDSKRFEGGIHELLGPRSIKGGRIFGSESSRTR